MLSEYLSFQKLITPMIIRILFWFGVATIAMASLGLMSQIWWAGLLLLLVGPVIWRVVCELLIVMFRLLEVLKDIRDDARKAV